MLSSDNKELIELTEYSIKTENYILALSPKNESTTAALQPSTLSESNKMDLNEFITLNNSSKTENLVDTIPESINIPNPNVATNTIVDYGCTVSENEPSDVENSDNVKTNVPGTKHKKTNAPKKKRKSTLSTRRKKISKGANSTSTKKNISQLQLSPNTTLNSGVASECASYEVDYLDDSDNESEISVYFNDDEEIEVDNEEDTATVPERYDIHESFAGFPKIIIKDAKLLIRGKVLLDLMSR